MTIVLPSTASSSELSEYLSETHPVPFKVLIQALSLAYLLPVRSPSADPSGCTEFVGPIASPSYVVLSLDPSGARISVQLFCPRFSTQS